MVRFLDGHLDPFVECQIAHIRDAKQGNRYDPGMSDEDRRSFPNLILLCKAHHELVDKRCPEQYPAEVLTMWKHAVEQGLDAGALSSLEDRDLAEALAFGAVAIRASLLDLGGRGGNAPGAGGGGGGAIGRGAVGGSGGPGGDLHLDGRPGAAPGAGGGGVGAVGPNARGGEGGGGGEMFERLIRFDEEDVASLRCEIGDAGRGGPGRGEDGSDTVVELIRADGTVAETICAAGGKGGAPGTLGTPAEVVAAILCNAAELREGLFYSLGAGWTTFTAETIPFEFRAPLMLVVQLDDDRAGHVSIGLEDPEGGRRELASPSFELPVDTLVPRVNALLSLSATIEQPGVWTLTISGSNTINLPLEIRTR
ncbi:hypothetical protein ACFQS3_10005 [Glycomyces mayteni]|uniref:HNH endonuclease n=1 Tax=Glycomyces mayteni TaxID=543887 RepID=A0ABW2D5C4_9ACTN